MSGSKRLRRVRVASEHTRGASGSAAVRHITGTGASTKRTTEGGTGRNKVSNKGCPPRGSSGGEYGPGSGRRARGAARCLSRGWTRAKNARGPCGCNDWSAFGERRSTERRGKSGSGRPPLHVRHRESTTVAERFVDHDAFGIQHDKGRALGHKARPAEALVEAFDAYRLRGGARRAPVTALHPRGHLGARGEMLNMALNIAMGPVPMLGAVMGIPPQASKWPRGRGAVMGARCY